MLFSVLFWHYINGFYIQVFRYYTQQLCIVIRNIQTKKTHNFLRCSNPLSPKPESEKVCR